MRWIMVLLLFIFSHSFAKTLTVGVPLFSPPFVMTADNKNHFIGFSIDIMSALCKRMSVNCEFKSHLFDKTFSEVVKHHIDVAIGSFTITPEREKSLLFSKPYLQSKASFVVLSTSQVARVDQLKRKKIGAESESIFIQYLQKEYHGEATILSFPSIAELMFALNDKTVEAVIFDNETADFWIGNNQDSFKKIGEPITIGNGIGIMTSLNNQSLINQINQGLARMKLDGSYLKIYNTYFGDMKQVSSPLY